MTSILVLPHGSLNCPICSDLLDSPYECSECHNLFCEECINLYLTTKDKYKRIYFCPICRNRKNSFSENSKINKILDKIKNSDKRLCKKCQIVLDLEKYSSHINKCWYKCKFCHLKFYNEDKFLEHYTKSKNHDLNQILDKFNRKSNLGNSQYGEIKRGKFENNLNKNEEKEKDNKVILVDKADFNTKYDLYFCGKENGINCHCCENKTCCPDGEICPECMKKNLKFHELKGYYLINKEGRACKYNNGYFHCYSKFDEIKKDKGGNYFKSQKICGNNYTCEACKNITKLMNYYLSSHTIKKLIERDIKAQKKNN